VGVVNSQAGSKVTKTPILYRPLYSIVPYTAAKEDRKVRATGSQGSIVECWCDLPILRFIVAPYLKATHALQSIFVPCETYLIGCRVKLLLQKSDIRFHAVLGSRGIVGCPHRKGEDTKYQLDGLDIERLTML